MQLIDKKLLDEISQQAAENERLRMNFNIHKSLDDKVQRLLNALEVGTKIPIHRHLNTDEMYIVLRGKLRVIFYDDKGDIVESQIIAPKEEVYGVNIPAGTWHSLEVLESGTVIFEVKEGPYKSLENSDILE